MAEEKKTDSETEHRVLSISQHRWFGKFQIRKYRTSWMGYPGQKVCFYLYRR